MNDDGVSPQERQRAEQIATELSRIAVRIAHSRQLWDKARDEAIPLVAEAKEISRKAIRSGDQTWFLNEKEVARILGVSRSTAVFWQKEAEE